MTDDDAMIRGLAGMVELGAALRAAGLVPRRLAAWAGTDRVAALPERLPALVDPLATQAAGALAVFVGGIAAQRERLRGIPVERLVDAKLLACVEPGVVRAPQAIVPLGPSLMVCDHHDAPDAEQLVAWPDDSSHHLAAAIPRGRRARWIDLGCGSAFAQLARPALASALVGVDLNPRAVAFARLGAALSGIGHFTAIEHGIAGVAVEPAELVTCNAPIPNVRDRAIWRRTDDAFFTALWPAVRGLLAPDGLAVVHARRDTIPELAGERVIVTYGDGFAILWWRPDGPERVVERHRPLTVERPHLDAADREDALALLG